MFMSDIMLALFLYAQNHDDVCIEKIENHFIYLTNGKRLSFAEIPDFLDKRDRYTVTVKTEYIE